MRVEHLLLACLCALALPGCITPRPAATVRFYEPPALPIDPAPTGAAAPRLNLLRVQAPAHLGQAMVWRRSDVELAFDERHRWAAEPSAQVDEALLHALFVRGPFRPQEGRTAARLEVRLVAYEGLLERRPLARVALIASYSPADPLGAGTDTRRFEADVQLARSSPEALAHGIGEALREVLSELLTWLAEREAPGR